ncbi:MAG: hypothetical protein JWO08_3694 [Verrucomicrobiaceae bacterium]|nr:hypothetical protein [Verrucomicrobiaceae bacterium]
MKPPSDIDTDIGNSIQNLGSRAQEKFGQAQNVLHEKYGQAQEKIGQAQEKVQEKFGQAQEMVQEKLGQAQEKCSTVAHQVEDYVREKPLNALCMAAGLGLGLTLLVRALTPPPTPRSRAVALLEDIQERLAELTHPALERGAALLDDGAQAVGNRIGSMHVDRQLSRLGRSIKGLFH